MQSSSTSTVLVLDAASRIGPWAHDALTDVGFACVVAETVPAAAHSLNARQVTLVVVPVAELGEWQSLLARLTESPGRTPILGVVDKDASVDVTPALKLGVTDLLTYPCTAKDLVERIAATIREHVTRPAATTTESSPIATLREVTEAAEQALFRAETAEARVSRAEEREHLRLARESLSHSLQVLLGTMIGTAESGAAGRAGHSRQVARLVKRMAEALGWAPERVRGIELAGLLHDIGLLSLPADLLAGSGPLDEHQRRLLHSHPDASAEILEPLSRVGVPVAAVRAHHERHDGSGYPRGLRGRQIPVGAELLAIADCYAALTNDRPHRAARTQDEALLILEKETTAGRLSAKALTVLHTALGRPTGNLPPRPGDSAALVV